YASRFRNYNVGGGGYFFLNHISNKNQFNPYYSKMHYGGEDLELLLIDKRGIKKNKMRKKSVQAGIVKVSGIGLVLLTCSNPILPKNSPNTFSTTGATFPKPTTSP
ncbi:MAG: hypothetical protein IKQ70_03415, partial [Bacteroidales bacterium]|nr:hypothetical protein [Bacteroidales bacterium]